MRFIILFLLLITSSWAMNESLEEGSYLAIPISGAVSDASPWDEEESSNEDLNRPLLAHDTLAIDGVMEEKVQLFRQLHLLECPQLSDLIDDVFFLVLRECMDTNFQ